MTNKRVYDPAVEAVAAMFPRFDVSDAVGTRATLAKFLEGLAAQGIERMSDDRVEEAERTIPGPSGAPDLKIRVYTPRDRAGAAPALVDFHGGGFILGDLEMDHPRCLVMAAEGGAVSINVDYRLAPEHPFPAAVEDCYAALTWVAAHAADLGIDPARIAVGGGSAGGNLAAAVALMARDRGGPPIAFQMLFYPIVDDRCQTASIRDGDGLYIWDSRNVRDTWQQYLGSERGEVSPYAAPARAKDLSGLPPAYLITCEHDPLRDEGLQYAMRLMEAGVPVELHGYPGTVHAFDFLTPSPVSTRAIADSVDAFKRAMAGGQSA